MPSLRRYFGYSALLILLACGCKRAEESTVKYVPPIGDGSPILDMEVKSVRPGPDDVLCEMVFTNKTDKPLRIGAGSLIALVMNLELRDGSGHIWHMGRPTVHGIPQRVMKETLAPHVPQSIPVAAFPGAALVMDSAQKDGSPTSRPSDGTYQYRLRRNCFLEVFDAEALHSSRIPVAIRGNTVVTNSENGSGTE